MTTKPKDPPLFELGREILAPFISTRIRGAVVSDIAHASCLDAPSMLSNENWWEELGLDFHKQSESFSLAWYDQFKVQTTALVDKAVRTTAASALSVFAAPYGFNPVALKRAKKDIAFYKKFIDGDDPFGFFVRPERDAAVRVKRAYGTLFRPKDGLCENLRWKSDFVPQNKRLQKEWQGFSRNRYAHARIWRHRDGPRPTVVAIHGFGAEGYALNQWFFALPWMYEVLGFDVALFNLPFHGRRQGPWSPFSGHGFFAGGPSRINEASAQAVYDFRTFVDYLVERRGVQKIGVTGISLGGFVTALLASLEDRLQFAVPNVPVTSLADIVQGWEPFGTLLRTSMRLSGVSLTDARAMMAVSSPLTWKPLLPKHRLMVIGGVGDRVVPPTHSRLLWDHWGRPHLYWFPGSHLIHVGKSAYLSELTKFFSEIQFEAR